MFLGRWSNRVTGLLIGLLIVVVLGGLLWKIVTDAPPHGGDFLQFYTAGLIVDRGDVEHLYDQPYFRGLQRPWTDDGMFSLYPPMMAIIMAPLAWLPYEGAVAAWWVVQALCFAGAGAMLYRMMPLDRRWRILALAALAAMFPVWIAVQMSHLSPLLLLILVGGIALHRRGSPGWAGLVFSAMAIKPQLAVGLLVWLALRRDLRAILGMAAGSMVQAVAVSVLLGPAVLLDYAHAMPAITGIVRTYHYSPIFEQSLGGIADNVVWLRGGGPGGRALARGLVHAASASLAAILMVRVMWSLRPWRRRKLPVTGHGDCPNSRRPLRGARAAKMGLSPSAAPYEYAAAVLFMVLFPPYLLVYDLALLAVPLVMLWSSSGWRKSIVLYASMLASVPALYLWMGFSLIGVAAFWTLFAITMAVEPLRREGHAVGRHEPIMEV